MQQFFHKVTGVVASLYTRNRQICAHSVIEIDIDVYPLYSVPSVKKKTEKRPKARSRKDFGALVLCVYKETRHICRIIFFCMHATISFIPVHLLNVYVSEHLRLRFAHSMTHFEGLSTTLLRLWCLEKLRRFRAKFFHFDHQRLVLVSTPMERWCWFFEILCRYHQSRGWESHPALLTLTLLRLSTNGWIPWVA